MYSICRYATNYSVKNNHPKRTENCFWGYLASLKVELSLGFIPVFNLLS
jgi:hypothetical protein